MEYQDKYETLVKMITEDFEIDGKKFNLKSDFDKFFVGGNKAAAGRIRKVMQEVKKLAQEVRTDVTNYKNNL